MIGHVFLRLHSMCSITTRNACVGLQIHIVLCTLTQSHAFQAAVGDVWWSVTSTKWRSVTYRKQSHACWKALELQQYMHMLYANIFVACFRNMYTQCNSIRCNSDDRIGLASLKFPTHSMLVVELSVMEAATKHARVRPLI